MSEPQGNFKMRFICGPNGKLLKGAPGNYTCGEIFQIPYHHSKREFWELIEDVPIVEVPDLSEEESVFEETIFLPEEETSESYDDAVIEQTPSAITPEDYNVDPDTPATIKPYMKLDLSSGKTRPVTDEEERELVKGSGEAVYSPEEQSSKGEKYDRDALKKLLDEAGVEYNNRAHTPTLQALVDELESEKES